MDNRRSFLKNEQQCKEIKRTLCTKIRKAKENNYKQNYEEIEKSEAKQFSHTQKGQETCWHH